MSFDGAAGWLVGEPNKGMRGDVHDDERGAPRRRHAGPRRWPRPPTRAAVAYARERLQRRALAGAEAPDQPADPIIVHPDVRRMLLTQRAFVEGGRALALWTALQIDTRTATPTPDAPRGGRRPRRAADADRQGVPHRHRLRGRPTSRCRSSAATATSASTAWSSSCATRASRRSTRAPTAIQALDLVGRKLPRGRRAAAAPLLPPRGAARRGGADAALADIAGPAATRCTACAGVTLWIGAQGDADPERGRRRGHRLPAPLRLHGARLAVGADGARRARARRRLRRRSSRPRGSTPPGCCRRPRRWPAR